MPAGEEPGEHGRIIAGPLGQLSKGQLLTLAFAAQGAEKFVDAQVFAQGHGFGLAGGGEDLLKRGFVALETVAQPAKFGKLVRAALDPGSGPAPDF